MIIYRLPCRTESKTTTKGPATTIRNRDPNCAINSKFIIYKMCYIFSKKVYYRKLTDACQTNASRKNNTGMIGNTSTSGSNGA
jgi:hypothetical protein